MSEISDIKIQNDEIEKHENERCVSFEAVCVKRYRALCKRWINNGAFFSDTRPKTQQVLSVSSKL